MSSYLMSVDRLLLFAYKITNKYLYRFITTKTKLLKIKTNRLTKNECLFILSHRSRHLYLCVVRN
jgi:hypothetical protein